MMQQFTCNESIPFAEYARRIVLATISMGNSQIGDFNDTPVICRHPVAPEEVENRVEQLIGIYQRDAQEHERADFERRQRASATSTIFFLGGEERGLFQRFIKALEGPVEIDPMHPLIHRLRQESDAELALRVMKLSQGIQKEYETGAYAFKWTRDDMLRILRAAIIIKEKRINNEGDTDAEATPGGA